MFIVFTLPGSLTVATLSLVGTVLSFLGGSYLAGLIFLGLTIGFGIAAFLNWADMTNV